MQTPPDTVLHWLDGSQRTPVQTWKFRGQPVIRIGRAENNDVIIRQQTVSRNHAVLRWEDGSWTLVNESKLGTLVNGVATSSTMLADADRFQLAPMGPVLSLHLEFDLSQPFNDSIGTVQVQATGGSIDQAKRDEQVQQIADSEYFRNLQQMAKKLKSNDSNVQ